MRASILLTGFALLVTGNCIAQTETKPPQYSAPNIDISVVSGLRSQTKHFANVAPLLRRLQADGWFAIRASMPTMKEADACRDVHFSGETKCRDALQKHVATVSSIAPPSVVLVFTSARNQLANLDCLGAGRYRISGQQSMLADYRLALSEGDKAEAERAKIATCLLSASRELSTELNRQQVSVACAPRSLEGEWRAKDGLVIRFEGPFNDPFNKSGEGKAVIVRPGHETSVQGDVLYSKIRRMADCNFLVTRHLWLDLRLHAAPPHIVGLVLDRAAGTLSDKYKGNHDTLFTRLSGPLPIKEHNE